MSRRHQSMVALLLGHCLVNAAGTRQAVDLLMTLPDVDDQRIAVMGHSGGGMTAYHAACLDKRIAACISSGAVSTYADAMGSVDNCSDNYLPGALLDFDLPDLSGLIAPRPLVVVNGTEDPITPIHGVRKAVRHIEHIYQSNGAAQAFAAVLRDGGHRFAHPMNWRNWIFCSIYHHQRPWRDQPA